MNLQTLAETVRAASHIRIVGSGSKEWFSARCEGEPLRMSDYAGIEELHAADQVVVVRAGTLISDLQHELARYGLCVPLPDPAETGNAPAGLPGTVGGGIAMNLPHALEGTTGNWRDWVLGLTLIRPDGTIAKCGGKAVKNVAGYDVARLMVGSRGELCVTAEAILKLYPLRALPSPNLVGRADWAPEDPGKWVAIVRTLRTDLSSFLERNASLVQAHDFETSTVWLAGDVGSRLDRQSEEIVVFGSPALGIPNSSALQIRTKQIFDPSDKLNRVIG